MSTHGSANRHPDTRRIVLRPWMLDVTKGDWPAAALLAQIAWWGQTSENTGKPRANYVRDGQHWLIRADNDPEWWDEIRLKPHQVKQAKGRLSRAGLIVVERYMKDGRPVSAVRPNHAGIAAATEGEVDYGRDYWTRTDLADQDQDPIGTNSVQSTGTNSVESWIGTNSVESIVRSGRSGEEQQSPPSAPDGAGSLAPSSPSSRSVDSPRVMSESANSGLTPGLPTPPIAAPPPPARRGAGMNFAAFWQRYPRKTHKAEAEMAWRSRARRDADPEEFAAGLERWCAHWLAAGTAEGHIPEGKTWLTRQDWAETPPKLTPAAPPRRDGKPHRPPPPLVRVENEPRYRPAPRNGALQ